MTSDLRVKFYGCRGSLPVSGEAFSRYGGSTSCVSVEADDLRIVLDAGSGIRELGNDLNHRGSEDGLDVFLFITHAHFDHLIGLPYFAPIYRPDTTIHFWGPRSPRFDSFKGTIENIVQPPYHPVSLFEMLSTKEFNDIGEADVVYFTRSRGPIQARPAQPRERNSVPADSDVLVSVHCMRGYNHPKSGVNIYKLVCGDKTVVYATDTEGYVNGDRRLIDFAQGADLLIHDAMYTEARYTSMPMPTQGYGHSTVEIATALAREADVGELVLFHHDPVSTDDDLDEVGELGRSLFEKTVVGRDGLVLEY